jgi:hypothetical protein
MLNPPKRKTIPNTTIVDGMPMIRPSIEAAANRAQNPAYRSGAETRALAPIGAAIEAADEGAATTSCPHDWQNRLPSSTRIPHFEQNTMSLTLAVAAAVI